MSTRLSIVLVSAFALVLIGIGSWVYLGNQTASSQVSSQSSLASSSSISASGVSSTIMSSLSSAQSSVSASSIITSSSEAVGVSRQQLSQSNGRNGALCYIAVDGVVYNVTNADGWSNGVHTASGGRVTCGIDGSALINQSPHGKRVLQGVPEVGKLMN